MLHRLQAPFRSGFTLDPSARSAQGLLGLWGPGPTGGTQWFDQSVGRKNDGTLTNMDPKTDWINDPIRGPALDFDAVDDRINIPNVVDNATIPQTMLAWINPDSVSTADRGYILSSNQVGGSVTLVLNINAVANGDIQFIVLTTGTAVQSLTAGSVVTVGEWQWVGMTWGGTVGTDISVLYRNGQVVANDSETAGTGNAIEAIGSWNIGGRDQDNLRNIDGKMNDVRFYNRIFSAAEMFDAYQATLNNPYGDLLAKPRRVFQIAAPPTGAIMNQFQGANLGADLFDGTLLV